MLGRHDIYGWSLGAVGDTGAYHHKAQWFHLPFFIGRSVFYFAATIIIALLVRRWIDRADNPPLYPLSAGGLIVYVLCMNFASADWVMSLDPKWYSTIFVVIFVTGQFLSALALMTALLALFARQRSLGDIIPTKAFHDLGNMLLAFVIFWAYVSFSQFLIIWSGNLPKEIAWYLDRSRGGWQWFAAALFLCQFLVPFALLLSREKKKNPRTLAWICLCLLAASVVNNFWLVAPSYHSTGVHLHWLDVTGGWRSAVSGLRSFSIFSNKEPLLPRDLVEEPTHE